MFTKSVAIVACLPSMAVAFGGSGGMSSNGALSKCIVDGQCAIEPRGDWNTVRPEAEKASQDALIRLREKLDEYPLAYMHLHSTVKNASATGDKYGLEAAKEQGLLGGRRLLQYGATPYGGGGAYCPSDSSWGGVGIYCRDDHLFFCNYAGELTYDIREACPYGCTIAPRGQADYCSDPPFQECYDSRTCPPGKECIVPEVAMYGGGGFNDGYGFCEDAEYQSACFSDSECAYDSYCDFYYTGECKKKAGAQCFNNAECPIEYYCDRSGSGTCQPNYTPSKPLSYFAGPYWDTAIGGSNDEIINMVYSVKDCADLCLAETRFYCATFEYAPEGNSCVLSRYTYPIIQAWGWNLYFRL